MWQFEVEWVGLEGERGHWVLDSDLSEGCREYHTQKCLLPQACFCLPDIAVL